MYWRRARTKKNDSALPPVSACCLRLASLPSKPMTRNEISSSQRRTQRQHPPPGTWGVPQRMPDPLEITHVGRVTALELPSLPPSPTTPCSATSACNPPSQPVTTPSSGATSCTSPAGRSTPSRSTLAELPGLGGRRGGRASDMGRPVLEPRVGGRRWRPRPKRERWGSRETAAGKGAAACLVLSPMP